jgi:hypothetical protein
LKAVFFNALGYRESDWGRLRTDIQNAALLCSATFPSMDCGEAILVPSCKCTTPTA